MKASKRLALIMAAVLVIQTGAVFAADGTAEEFDDAALTKTDAPADAAVFFDGEEEESEAQSEEFSESQSEPLLEDGEGSGSGDLSGDGIIGDDIIADGIIEEAFGEETYAVVEETETEYEVIAEEFLDEDSEEMAGGERAVHSHDGVSFEPWDKNGELPSDSGNYYLDKDVEISETWTISDGQDIKLCLHDHTIRYTADTGGVILVGGSGQLCLYDCEKTEHRYKIIDDLAQLDDNGSETFYGGCITGGKGTVRKSTAYGGGIYIPDSGKVTIYGGTILGNQTSNGTFNYGGGICVDGSGKLEIDGGSLIGNKAENGGGICIAGNLSSSIMKNGAIRRNHGIDCAGGVHVLAGSFTMTGGEITDNTTDSMQGGGVFVNYGNTNMIVSGKPVITGNTGSSGSSNVFLIFSVHLPPQAIIKVDGELTYGAAIGVGVSNAYPYSVYPLTEGFTTGFKNAMPEEDPARFFFSDDPGYLVAKNSNGEAGLKEWAASVTAGTKTTGYPTLEEALDAWDDNSGSTLTLMQDAQISKTILVNNRTAVLDLNGFGIRKVPDQNSSVVNSVIKVAGGGILTLKDSRPNAEHHYLIGNDGLAVVNDAGDLVFKGGYITGGKGEQLNVSEWPFFGGGIYIESGSVTMNGGTIIGNSVSTSNNSRWNSGGGVCVGAPEGSNPAVFTLNGGSIIGNTAEGIGAGVYVSGSGSFSMNGGSIETNYATFGSGGVRVQGGGSFIMTDGSISGNRVSGTGGGVFSSGTFTMSGGSITDNTADKRGDPGTVGKGGGVYIYATGTFTMSGGSITENTAKNGTDTTTIAKGGGVYAETGCTFNVSGNSVIQENKADNKGADNVYLAENSPASITVHGTMSPDAKIGVTMESIGVFTSGFGTKMPSAEPSSYFTSDDPRYEVAATTGSGILEGMLRKPQAVITELPSGNKRYADGTEQPLLSTPGQAEGGTLLYAVNNDKSTAPEPDADGTPEEERKWKPSIPEKAEAGSYCVWVKAAGDDAHSDSDAKCVVSRICFPVVFRVEDGAWDDGTRGDKMVDLSRYEDEDLLLKLEDGDIPAAGSRPDADFLEGAWDEVPPTDRAISEAKTFTYRYVEKERISKAVTFRVVNGAWDDGSAAEKKVILNGHAGDTLRLAADQIPAAGSRPAAGYKAGNWDTVPGAGAAITEDTVFTYTYAQDEKVPDVPVKAAPKFEVKDGFHPSGTGNKLTVSWGSVQDADYYEVYAQYCGGGECKKIRTVSGDKTKTSFSKFLGEEFDQTKCFKMYVAAVRGGKRIARTRLAHVAGRKNKKYTNIKKVKLPRSSYTMTVGKTKKLKPKAVLENKNKKELPAKKHGTARFKYDSTDTSVATVSKSGKIKAVGKGTCEIWVYALSGASQKVTITVE